MIAVQMYGIVRKELLEIMRGARWAALAGIVGSIVFQVFIVRQIVRLGGMPEFRDGAVDILRVGPTMSLLFVGPVMMPMFGNTILGRSMFREQVLGTLMPLLATGIRPGFLWAMKVCAAFIASYIVTLVALVINAFIIAFYFKLPVTGPVGLWGEILFIAPISSLSVLATASLLYWTARSLSIVVGIAPTLLCIWLASRAPTLLSSSFLDGAIVLSAGGAIVMCAGLAMIVNRLSRKVLVGL